MVMTALMVDCLALCSTTSPPDTQAVPNVQLQGMQMAADPKCTPQEPAGHLIPQQIELEAHE